MRERIIDLYSRAKAFSESSNANWWSGVDDRDRFMTGSGKKSREAWVLGRFADAYNANSSQRIIFAEEREPPDFALYGEFGEPLGFAEITEWLDPKRKRDDEYKSPPRRKVIDVPDCEKRRADAIKRLEEQLGNKFEAACGYPQGTSLIIHFNVNNVLWYESDPRDRAESDSVSEIVWKMRDSIPSTVTKIWLLSPTRGPGSIINQIYPERCRHEGNWLADATDPAR